MDVLTPAPELKPEPAERKEKMDLFPCPMCGEGCCFVFNHVDPDAGRRVWCLCECGTLFQLPDQAPLPDEDRAPGYRDRRDNIGPWMDRFTWNKRLYLPMIEDMQFGRKILDVRSWHPVSLDWLRDRGWVPYGVDDCPEAEFGDYPYQACDFMDMVPVEPFRRFNLIWMQDSIQHYPDPRPVLRKAFSMLEPMGMLFVSAPDVSYMHRVNPVNFGHFDPIPNRILMRGETFADLAEKVGFKTVLLRKNSSRCGTVYDNFHWLGQRKV